MKTILSTAYFPSLSWCRVLMDAEDAVLDVHEHFVKQSQRNRCMILGPNGPLKLIVPLERRKNHMAVKDVKISYADNWQKLHWKSLEAAYRSSPYFEYYEEDLRSIVADSSYKFLAELNQASMEFIFKVFDLDRNPSPSDKYEEGGDGILDERNADHLSPSGLRVVKPYHQVFGDRMDFQANLSALDLICNEGPNSINLLA